MDFSNIFNNGNNDGGTDHAEPTAAKDPLEYEKEIRRLKVCLLNMNWHSGETKAKTLKALDAGEPLEKIFIDLCEGVALMTDEPLFLKAVKSKLKAHKVA